MMYFDFWFAQKPVRHEILLLVPSMVVDDEMPEVVEHCLLGAGWADNSIFLLDFAV